jgi:hypothetical protein
MSKIYKIFLTMRENISYFNIFAKKEPEGTPGLIVTTMCS